MAKTLLIKAFNEFNKEWKTGNAFNRIILVFLLLVLLVVTFFIGWVIFIFYKISLSSLLNGLIIPLGFNLQSPLTYLSLISFGLALGIAVFTLFKIKINWYLVSTIFLTAILLIYGLSFINETYSKDLPVNLTANILSENDYNILKNHSCSFPLLTCHSRPNRETFVIDKQLVCTFQLSEQCNHSLDKLIVVKYYTNPSNISREEKYATDNYFYLEIPIDENLEGVLIRPSFENKENLLQFPEPAHYLISLTQKYSSEEYNQRKKDKLLLIISLFSLSIFSSVVAVNNLKQILKKEK